MLKRIFLLSVLSVGSFGAADASYYEPHWQSRTMTIAVQAWGVGPGATLLLGDSNTELFRPVNVGGCEIINGGLGGARSEDLAARSAAIAEIVKPSVVHVMVGTNDVLQGVQQSQFRDNLRRIVDSFEKAGARVVLWEIPPVGFSKATTTEAVNASIETVAAEKNVSLERTWFAEMLDKSGRPKPNWLIGDDVHLSPNAQKLRINGIENACKR